MRTSNDRVEGQLTGAKSARSRTTLAALLPPQFVDWFAARGWQAHAHQVDMLVAARDGASALLIAPTGGGKTLAGFLPSLVELAAGPVPTHLHKLYISPLKALAVDVHRNLEIPIAEMDLGISAENRTGDTPQSKRQRQRLRPPQILMTTPESFALLLSYDNAADYFANLSCVIVDELHAIEENKRGDLLALGLARLARLAPQCRRVGLSATVADPKRLVDWLSFDGRGEGVRLVRGAPGREPEVEILTVDNHIPWSGHLGRHAVGGIFRQIEQAKTAIVFVNTRSQAEILFQELWRQNDDGLAIALHHGSLSAEQRRKVEAAMARGDLRGVVATSSLDLGVDWAAVDLVIQVGAPKGSTRLLQRTGRANHRLDQPSRAVLAPANRFEYLECQAAVDAVREGTLDALPPRPGGYDVLAQHVLGMACSAPFGADELFDEVTRAYPYRDLPRGDFDDVLGFVENGGYALGAYDRYHRLGRGSDGQYEIAGPKFVRQYRLNVGTIVEAPMLKVRLGRGRVLGEVEESFFTGMIAGDTFVFAGHLLAFQRIRETDAEVTRAKGGSPKVPQYMGGRFPLSTHLAERVRGLLADPSGWAAFPGPVHEWLELQRWRSVMPSRDGLLVESFPKGDRFYLVLYCFEGRNAHQTLGMLLTRRMERAGLSPMGFVASDYVLGIWSLKPAPHDLSQLLDEDMLGDDLEAWMAESSMLKRTFRNIAVIAGLIERRHPGQKKTGRQVTFNADLIYDVLRAHEPNHILLRATRADAAAGLTDIRRLADMLARIEGKILHRRLDRVSPLAVPVLLEIGKESVYGESLDELIDAAVADRERELIAEATADIEPRQLDL